MISGLMSIACRGVRGATTVETDTRRDVLIATGELLLLMIQANGIHPEDVASAYFTTTADLTSEYPALAARKIGWLEVPLLCGHEMGVPEGLPRCIRVMVHWNTDRRQDEIRHLYLRDAQRLRPDLVDLVAIPEVVELPVDLLD